MAETEPLMAEKMELEVPLPSFTSIKPTPRGRKPQAIAHRGYKAAHPENTMAAFRGAVEVGAHAIETDIHISRDDVVVLSHDPTLRRCFGSDEKIVECDWEYLSTLRTLREPHEPMPRLKDLLEYLTTPGLEDIWLLLDIKLQPWPSLLVEPLRRNKYAAWAKGDSHAENVFKLLASTLKQVKPSRPWNQRILLGCWAAKYLPLCTKYLPGYSITHIGFNIQYARQFLKVPGVSFNMQLGILAGPCGKSFMRDVRKAGRSLLAWTVNDEEWMKWCIRKEVDGVITDDPKKYLEVVDSYNGEKTSHTLKAWSLVVRINIWFTVFSYLFRYRYGFKIDTNKVKQSLEGSSTKA